MVKRTLLSQRLPKRPRSHELEERSISEFQNQIPDNWTYRPKGRDYGIDGEVEIFTKAGYTTGHLFFVQLKATDDVSSNGRRVRIKTRTYNYYRQLSIPILIVRWSNKEKVLYGRWIYALDPTRQQLDADTFSFELQTIDRWGKDTAHKIERDLEQFKAVTSAPLSVPVEIGLKAELTESNHQVTFGSSLDELRLLIEAKRLPLNLRSVISDESVIAIESREHEIRVGVGKKGGAVLDLTKQSWATWDEKENAKLLLALIAIALARVKQDGIALKIVMAALGEFATLSSPQMQIELAALLSRNDRINEVIDLVSKVVSPHPELVLRATASALVHRRHASEVQLQQLVEGMLRAATNATTKERATLHYNIANIELWRNRYVDAQTQLRMALDLDPSYGQRDYYHRDLGVCLFELGQFHEAAIAYTQAKRLGLKEDIRNLQADCLFHSGEYQRATDLWHLYLLETKSNNQLVSWALPQYVATYFSRILGIQSQQRKKNTYPATAVIPFEKTDSLERAFGRCRPLLGLDALDGFVWFNLGVLAAQEGNQSFAEFAFTVVGLVNRNDPEAWCNALVAGLLAKSPALRISSVVYHGMRFCGQAFRSRVVAKVRNEHGEEAATGYGTMIDGIYESIGGRDDPSTKMRIIAADGKRYREIDLEKRFLTNKGEDR